MTLPLLQPLALGEGDRLLVTTGFVLSILTVTETEPVRPAPLVAVQAIAVPPVSEVRMVVPHPEEEATPDSGSETDQLTVTLPVFHPFTLGLGVTVGTITGGVESAPKVAVRVTGADMLTEVLGLRVELSSHWTKKYPTPGPPLMAASTPMVPVDAPALSHTVNGAVSEAVPEDTPFRYTAVG